MWPVLFRIPLPFLGRDLPVPSFGAMVALGFLAASFLLQRYARRFGSDPARDGERFDDVALRVLVAGILGARALYVLVHRGEFEGRWLAALAIWEGGLVFYGGFLAAIAAGLLRVRRLGMDLWNSADLGLAAAFVGLGIGRIGCLLVGDDYGREAPEWLPFPLAIRVPDPIPDRAMWDEFDAGAKLYATQVFLSLNAFLLAGLARWMLPRRRFAGQVLWTTTGVYCVTRSILEVFRGDDDARGMLFSSHLSTSQAISIPLLVVSLAMYARLARRRRRTQDR